MPANGNSYVATISDASTGAGAAMTSINDIAAIVVGLPFAAGSFTVPTECFRLQVKRLQLTTSQRATLQGTARLRVSN